MIEVTRTSHHPELYKEGGGVVSSALSLLTKPLRHIPFGSIVNKSIDLLPVELHIPGYQYCGPGTKLKKRLARGES